MRYADPLSCPDCREPIVAGADRCAACDLGLRGPVAQRLYQTLQVADGLLAELRAASPAAASRLAATAAGAGSSAAPPAGPAGLAGLAGPDRPGRGRIGAASVPRILLTAGALCLLVASAVFLAVAWATLGVGGRTAVLVGLTGASGALTWRLAGRGLRGGAEALALVTLGLLALDVLGADRAGWLPALGDGGLLVVLGAPLALAAGGGVLLVRRTPVAGLTGAELVAGAGAALLAVGVATLTPLATGGASLLVLLLTGAAAGLAHRLAMPFATAAAGVVAAGSWLLLVLDGLARVVEHPTWAGLWARAEGWPLLAAAVVAGVLSAARPLPEAWRVAAGAAGLGALAALAAGPAVDESLTVLMLTGVAVSGAAAAPAWTLAGPWRLVGGAAAVPAAAGVLVGSVGLAGLALERAAVAAATLWQGTAAGRLPSAAPLGPGDDRPAAWVLPLGVAALVLLVVALCRASRAADRVVAPVLDLRLLVALTALTLVTTLASYPVPVWSLVAGLLGSAAGLLGWWLRRPSPLLLGLVAGLATAAVPVSLYAAPLTLLATGGVTVLAAVPHLRARAAVVAAAAGLVAAAGLAAALWTLGHLTEVEAAWRALTVLVALALVVLVLPLLPDRWWRAVAVEARAGVEAGAAAVALPVALAGVLLGAGPAASWTAVYLTLAGVAVTAMALARSDRRMLAAPGGLLLLAASWVRLWELGVSEPEAYTLPGAAVLAVLGLLRLRRDAATTTTYALAPALGLGLVPTLLWSLVEPPGWRALLLGLACVALVLVGVERRWTAPLVAGAVVGGLLVLRLAGPTIGAAVPRWVLIGVAGALLISLGVTWERRLRETRRLLGYVGALR